MEEVPPLNSEQVVLCTSGIDTSVPVLSPSACGDASLVLVPVSCLSPNEALEWSYGVSPAQLRDTQLSDASPYRENPLGSYSKSPPGGGYESTHKAGLARSRLVEEEAGDQLPLLPPEPCVRHPGSIVNSLVTSIDELPKGVSAQRQVTEKTSVLAERGSGRESPVTPGSAKPCAISRRRESNRRAQQRFRRRQKETILALQRNVEKLTEKVHSLELEKWSLERELQILKGFHW